jgi:iron complex transport system substrate-binding protein
MIFKRFFFTIRLLSLFLLLPAQAPQRIVSLVPSITKQLYDLDIQYRIVGCTSYCKAKDLKGVEIVASAIQVSIEKTLMLKPDLVIISSLTNPKTVESLKKMGLRTIYFDAPKSFDDLCNQFIRLADVCDMRERAELIVRKQKLRLDKIISDIPKSGKPVIFIQIGSNPLWTVIDNSFMGDYIRLLGGVNLAAGLKSGSINRESVLLKNPDIIFITSMGVATEQEKLTWLKYESLNAVKNNKIFILDADKTNAPTVIEFVDVVKQMKEDIYSIN